MESKKEKKPRYSCQYKTAKGFKEAPPEVCAERKLVMLYGKKQVDLDKVASRKNLNRRTIVLRDEMGEVSGDTYFLNKMLHNEKDPEKRKVLKKIVNKGTKKMRDISDKLKEINKLKQLK